MFDEKGRVWFTSRIRPNANPDYCKKGSEHPSAKAFPIDSGGRNLPCLRSDSREVHADPHLLPDAPSQLRDGCQPDAVDQPGRGRAAGHRLVEPQDVRGDRRRSEIARLDAIRPRYQWQRQARRIYRAEPAAGPGQGPATGAKPLHRGDQPVRRFGLGIGPGLSWRCDPRRPWARSDPHRTDRILSSRRYPASVRAVPMSIPTACSGSSLASGHLGSFDRRKCKGPLNGPNAHRRALPGRLDAAIRCRGRNSGGQRSGKRRGQLLRLGRLVRCVRAGT